MIRTTFILLSILLLSTSISAQGWDWGKGSMGNNITSWPVAADTKGNVFAAGVSSGLVSFDNYLPSFTSAENQIVITKYDDWGNFLWSRNIPIKDNSSVINIATDTFGHCYLLGWMADSSLEIGPFTLYNSIYPQTQYFIVKYDEEGNVLWAKNDGGRSVAGSIPPIVLDSTSTVKLLGLGTISSDNTGNIYVATGFNLPSVNIGSYTLTNKNTSGTTDDIDLAKYDGSGNVIWAKSSGGTGEDIPCGLTITPAGSVYIAGLFNSDSVVFGSSVIKDTSTQPQKWNAFIGRYNALGNPVWGEGSGGLGKVYASGIASDVNNNVYITGGTDEDSIRFGNLKIVDTNSFAPVLYVVKFDSFNNAIWYRTIGSPTGSAAWGYGAAMSFGLDLWVSGAFKDEISINGNLLDTPAASLDPVFIASFDTAGEYVGSAALQSGSSQQQGIACDWWGGVYLCADYKYPCSPFIIAGDVLANVSFEEHWQYLAKYGAGGSGPVGGMVIKYDSFDVSMCPYDSVNLLAPPGYAIYHWNNGSSDTSMMATTAGIYWLTGIGNNIMLIDTFKVKTDTGLCNCNAFLPTAFTPNGDGKNDTYAPLFESDCLITHYAFSIYNRWGQRVFYSEDPYAKWDGKYKGIDADLDVYMFYLKYTTNPSYPEHVRKGDLTLVR